MQSKLRVAVAGLGAIGWPLVQALDAGEIPGCALVAVSARDTESAQNRINTLKVAVPVLPLPSCMNRPISWWSAFHPSN